MSKFLLTGGSGTLGTELQKHLDCVAPSSYQCDVRNSMIVNNLPSLLFNWTGDDLAHYSGIIHCAAYTDVPGAEVNRKEAIEANIIGTRNIVKLNETYKLPLYYISTDYVYSGTSGDYKETDNTGPFNFYGFTKLAGEAFLDPDKDLIIRTSFKPNNLWPDKYQATFTDIYTSADFVDVIAKEMALAIDSDLTGIINIGTERKSLYELAKRRYPEVKEMSREDVSNVFMPSDISMNVDKFKEFKKSLEGAK